jgi:uncharacterized protein involved in exopolysaccharide biosynthesis
MSTNGFQATVSETSHLEPLEVDHNVDGDAEKVSRVSVPAPNWVTNTALIWQRRRLLLRAAVVSLLVGLLVAFTLPKQYKSSARIMPPSNSGANTAMLAALAGRTFGGLGGLGNLATGLLGANNSTALFVELLRSGTVADNLMNRYDLQQVYRKRYRVDTAKYLAKHTTVVDDKKSGVITITVEDTDPRRARDLAQGYLDELNQLLNRTSTSSAHQERVFIEKRLAKVKTDLEYAQLQMSQFASTHDTIDIKEQTRAMVDAASRLQAQLIVEQSGLDSLRQVYGDANVRVRSAEARIGVLKSQLNKMGGSSAPLPEDDETSADNAGTAKVGAELYPPLRQLPRLAVPYADLYRQVQVQETVFELLTQQYELARIQEAKDIPVVSVIDSPGIPEKKSFPPRLLLALALAIVFTGATAAYVIFAAQWKQIDSDDPRKLLFTEISSAVKIAFHKYWPGKVAA